MLECSITVGCKDLPVTNIPAYWPIRKLQRKWSSQYSLCTVIYKILSCYFKCLYFLIPIHNLINEKTLSKSAHKSIVCTSNSQWFFAKKYFFLFSRIISQKLIIACLFFNKSHLKPFLSYLPCIARYFSIIFNVKKCALYSIK